MELPKYVKVNRYGDVFMGTLKEASNWLRVRISVLAKYIMDGDHKGNERLKNVSITPTTLAAINAAKKSKKDIYFADTEKPKDYLVLRHTEFKLHNIYVNRYSNYVVCIKSDEKADEYHFVALYVSPEGNFRMADPKNKNCLIVANGKGKRDGKQFIFILDINKVDAKTFNEFVEIRHWYHKKIGLPMTNEKVSVPETQVIETMKPGILDLAVLQDRIKNLEIFIENKLNKGTAS